MSRQPRHQPRSCGTWPSPVTPALAAGKTVTLSEVSVCGRSVFWLERRPADKGRTALVLWQEGHDPRDLTGPECDVATRVNEYGGGAYAAHGASIVFSNKRDGAVYRLDLPQDQPVRLAGGSGLRYASFAFSPDGGTVFAVREDHREAGEPVQTLVALSREGEAIIAEGADFYSSPTPSPDGRHLAWISWNHPAMPWTATSLCVMSLADDALQPRVLSDNSPTSLTEPQWLDNRTLIAVSDRSGWWNLWRFSLDGAAPAPLCPMSAEIGQPHWVFGQRSYRLLPDGDILALAVRDGQTETLLLTPENGGYTASPLALGLPGQCPDRRESGAFAWLDAPSDAPPAVVTGCPGQLPRRLREATSLPFGKDDISIPETVRFPLPDGTPGHAFFYLPASAAFCVPDGERPPLLVMAHGGPTARAGEGFSLKVQWWTSHGFAVLDVNYSGSTGFGRPYRERLDGQWGVRDVEDCIAAARFMADSGRIDAGRIAIRGSSAGGLTVLAALAGSDVFSAGVSLYGVTDLRTLAEETHRFEAHYLDSLVGPWPEAEAVYRDRSPLFMADKIHAPVLFLQGLDDTVVPPAQARSMVAALRENGLSCPLVEFSGEGHGFRSEDAVRRAFQLELAFYARVFGFEPAGVSRAEISEIF